MDHVADIAFVVFSVCAAVVIKSPPRLPPLGQPPLRDGRLFYASPRAARRVCDGPRNASRCARPRTHSTPPDVGVACPRSTPVALRRAHCARAPTVRRSATEVAGERSRATAHSRPAPLSPTGAQHAASRQDSASSADATTRQISGDGGDRPPSTIIRYGPILLISMTPPHPRSLAARYDNQTIIATDLSGDSQRDTIIDSIVADDVTGTGSRVIICGDLMRLGG